jgi:hypothetical protein
MNAAILQKRVIDITGYELQQLIDERLNQIFDQREKQQAVKKTYSINQLVKLKLIGGRDKIRSLIENKIITPMPDGSISEAEVNRYLENKK